jgi:diaminohydroxyphosphoribosylaminopyrimidine deaminase/5-amino-6-(5-phosphoribosylamino)uracil reductase
MVFSQSEALYDCCRAPRSAGRHAGDCIHEGFMRAAISEADKARGTTGDNPWVGCVIVDGSGAIVARGHTQGPGEDHAEIVAMHEARARGIDLAQTTLYSTLEPCSFHGRTPACSRAVIDAGVPCIVTGIHDPNPRVDGIGLRMLREGGVRVIEDVGAVAITHQLATWIFAQHPHEPLRRARALFLANGRSREPTVRQLIEHYAIDRASAEQVVARLDDA